MSWKVIGQTATTTPEQPKHQALQELGGVNALIDWGSIYSNRQQDELP